MTGLGAIILLFAIGLFLLVLDIFIPSHGALAISSLFFIGWAIYRTFADHGQSAGIVSILACLIVLPVIALAAIRVWPRTPIGRRIAPANLVSRPEDSSVPSEELMTLVGRRGRAVSTLRPVGICEFGGRRVACLAESGMIDAGREVVGIGAAGGQLTVAPVAT